MSERILELDSSNAIVTVSIAGRRIIVSQILWGFLDCVILLERI